MPPIKKKMFGYDQEQVDDAMKELNEEIFRLRQELFTSAKSGGTAPAEIEAERFQMLGTIDTLKTQLSKKENEVATLLYQQKNPATKPDGAAAENANVQMAGYQRAITERDTELARVKQEVGNLQAQYTQLVEQYNDMAATSSRKSTPDLHLIEKVYMRAFSGAREIAYDTRSNVVELTDRVCSELHNNINETAGVYNELLVAKNNLETFVSQGMRHFKALEKMLETVSNTDINTADYVRRLDESKIKIMNDIEKGIAAFEMDMETGFPLNDKPKPAAPLPLFEPVKTMPPVIENQPAAEVITQKPAYNYVDVSDDMPAEDDETDDAYNPEDELRDMKEAILREQRQAAEARLAAEQAPQIIPPVIEQMKMPETVPLAPVIPSPIMQNPIIPAVATAETRSEEPLKKSKINIQDILKKYSNIN